MRSGKGVDVHKFYIAGMLMALVVFSWAWAVPSYAQEKPQSGGTLNMALAYTPPSYDAHRETTIGTVQPLLPHYSLLLKIDPDHYPKVIGDLAESWTVSQDQKTYTFKIRKGVKFHDGSLLTAKDIKATYDKIIFPPPGVTSIRKAFYAMVQKVEAPDDHTVIFRLTRVSASFLASLAAPYNFVYKADILAKDPKWYERNIMGTGPFRFVEHVAGSHWAGKRNEDYFIKGRPYLDGYRITFIADMGARLAAIRAGRVHGDFIMFSPSQRDDLVRAMGDKIKVEEISSPSTNTVVFNSEKKPFGDPRVRRALNLALDRWEGSKVLQRISPLKEVGGFLRPGSEFAMTEAELTQLGGFGKDIQASRKEARRLLREAGIPEGFSFELKNRSMGKEYEVAAIWLIDQWRQIGVNVKQTVHDLATVKRDLQTGNFEVYLDAISDYMDEPDLQFIRIISHDKSPMSYGRYIDRTLDELYERQSKAMNPAERKKLCDQFQKRVLDEMAYCLPTPWRHRIVPYSAKVKGWKALPSHFLNQDLTNVWLAKD